MPIISLHSILFVGSDPKALEYFAIGNKQHEWVLSMLVGSHVLWGFEFEHCIEVGFAPSLNPRFFNSLSSLPILSKQPSIFKVLASSVVKSIGFFVIRNLGEDITAEGQTKVHEDFFEVDEKSTTSSEFSTSCLDENNEKL